MNSFKPPAIKRKDFAIAPVVLLSIVWFMFSSAAFLTRAAEPLRLCVSTPDLASIAKEVGGNWVSIFCFSTGPQDPHEIEIRPGFAKELEAAHLYLQAGLGLENAWLKDLMRPVKNSAIKPGGAGNVNAGFDVRALAWCWRALRQRMFE